MKSEKAAIKKPYGRLYVYIAYWVLYLLFFSVQRFFAASYFITGTGLIEAGVQNSILNSFLTNLAYLPGVILVTHFVTEFLLPRYYFRNRFFHFSIFLVLTILLYPILAYLVREGIVDAYINTHPESYSFYNYFAAMLIFVFGLAPLAWFKIATHLKEDVLFHQKLDNDRLNAMLKLKETELKLLRSQLHPHFLFNTLNNLYSLALEKSDKTPDLIIRLGDMLSYIIYDCNSDKVLLVKEIDFLKSYIELQKVRYVSCDIKLEITGDIDNQKIAPMLLHTFLDNSFKHGAAKISGDSWIKIAIDVYNGFIDFRVENNKPAGQELNKDAGGIGIENAKKRLRLIYRDRYDLNIDQTEFTYSVFLKLLL
ncbi:MAG: sensor histidine kinase [Bacteroidales bacterium]